MNGAVQKLAWILCGLLIAGGVWLVRGRDAEAMVPRRSDGGQCVFNSDCGYPLVCQGSYCRAQCLNTRDCTGGWVCVFSERDAQGKGLPNSAMCVDPKTVSIARSIAQAGVDYPGNDIGNFAMPVPDPVGCDEACRGEPSCVAWTYVKPGAQGLLPRCWLKNKVGEPVKNANAVSGKKP